MSCRNDPDRIARFSEKLERGVCRDFIPGDILEPNDHLIDGFCLVGMPRPSAILITNAQVSVSVDPYESIGSLTVQQGKSNKEGSNKGSRNAVFHGVIGKQFSD